MSNIDAVCEDFMYYATHARLQRNVGDASPRSLEKYLEALKSYMAAVGENEYPGHESDYDAAYMLMVAVGPLSGIHAKAITKYFRFFAERCIHYGVNPDIHGVIAEMMPIFRDGESKLIARGGPGHRMKRNGEASHRAGC